ncbi:MAG: cytochrome P450, partial [Thermoleophilia bacterium]|nr:cytochrome P450 [Thermoleophilia bacterium]
FKRDPIGTISAAAAACGDAARLRLWRPTVLLGHPDDARHVLVTNAVNYERAGLEPLWRLFGTGLINDRQPGHLPQRRMAQPFYTPAAAAGSVAPALACMAPVSASWMSGQAVNVAEELLRANMAFAGRTVLGIDDPDAAQELFQLVHRTHVKGVRIMTCPCHAVNALPLRRLRLYRRYGDRLDRRIEREIDERLAGKRAAESGNFLDHLLAQQRASPGLIDRRRLIDHIKTMFAASVEPITTPTASALWRLACHPEHEERLAAEAGAFDWASPVGLLDRLPFATAFWREALRLHPSNWLMPRRARADDTLPGGLRVRAGHDVYISQYLIHHDPRFFPDPERFDPARFETDPPGRDRFLPFGRGPRSCIGATVAEQVGVALLARLALEWKFEPVPGSRPEMESLNLFISQLRGTRLVLRASRRAHPGPAAPPAHPAGATR